MDSSTSIGQHVPADSNELIAQFWAFVKQKTIGIDPSNLRNMDELPVAFDLPGRYTVDFRDKEDVSIATTGIACFIKFLTF